MNSLTALVLDNHQKIDLNQIKIITEQENRSVARKPRDAAAVLFSLKFADNIHYKFKGSQPSKARLQNFKHRASSYVLTRWENVT